MNLRKKLRNFFTLSRAHDGFTLVELIVVIAILAILGGVAVPAYSGYVKKAERAGDEQLLAAVNKAYASACTANGSDIWLENSAVAALNADGTVADVYKTAAGDAYNVAFDQFYAGNEAAAFKTIDSLIYDAVLHQFVDPLTTSSLTIAYGDGFVQLTGEAITALKNSTYNALTNKQLLTQVDSATGIATHLNAMQTILGGQAFQRSAMEALGLSDPAAVDTKKTELAKEALKKQDAYKDMTPEQFEAALTADPNILKNAELAVMGNALVLYTAQQTTETLTAETAKEQLKSATQDSIMANFSGTEAQQQAGMNQSALAYGMYYAYVNSGAEGSAGLEKNDIQPDDVLGVLGTENFNKYLDTKQGQADMEAYLAALEMVDSSTDSTAAVEKLMVNGFNDDDLVAILNQSMGKS